MMAHRLRPALLRSRRRALVPVAILVARKLELSLMKVGIPALAGRSSTASSRRIPGRCSPSMPWART
jgi:hypothetical protein